LSGLPLPEPLALVAASRVGASLAARLGQAWPDAERHVLAAYLDLAGPGALPVESPLSSLIGELFERCRGLVLLLPVGAAVRLVAPHLVDKRRDPAVVVVDDGGRFAVSLLAGHAGGANRLAEAVADLLGARPVVTTAAEQRGLPVPELLGLPYGWRLQAGRDALLRAATALVNGLSLAVYQDAGQRDWLPPETPVCRFENLDALVAAAPSAALLVTDRQLPAELAERSVVWRPRWLVAGVGCSRGASSEEIGGLLHAALQRGGLSMDGLGLLVTLDRKLDEPGLMALTGQLGLELRGFQASELVEVPVPGPSEVVRAAVGTPSVAEAAALLESGGQLLVPKQRSACATVAIATRQRP
jgi:cobalamin biosynthesis protein CbiG